MRTSRAGVELKRKNILSIESWDLPILEVRKSSQRKAKKAWLVGKKEKKERKILVALTKENVSRWKCE